VRTEGLSILAAVAVHGALLLIARSMPPPTLISTADWRVVNTIDIELPPTPAPVAERERPLPTPGPEAPRAREAERPPEARVASRGSVGPTPDNTAAPVEQPQGPPSPSAAPQPSGTRFDELPDEPRGVLGIPGVPGVGGPVWAIPGVIPTAAAAAPAPTEAPKARPVDRDIAGQVIRQAMSDKDKSLGIESAAAGTVSSTVREVIQGSDVPNDSKGSIEFRIGPGGQVLGWKVVGASGGNADVWVRAARDAAARLAGKGLVLAGQYARGATITIDIVSKVQPPSGSKGGLSGAGFNFDVSNIGAHASRVVRTSYRIAAAR
jgi:hypothetical protein